MFYIYYEKNDESGEGTRANISELTDRASADTRFELLSHHPDITHLEMIEGTQVRVYTPLVDVDDFTTALEPSEVNYLLEQSPEAIAEQQSDKAREDEAERGFIREGYDDIPF